MSRPKIIFVNRVYWPSEAATAQLLTDLAEGLARSEHAVHVVAAGSGPEKRAGVTIHYTGGDYRHRGALSQLWNYVRFLVRARSALRRLVAPGDVVVLKTDPPLLAAALTPLARARGAQVVQWIQDVYPEIVSQHYGVIVRPLLWPLRTWRDRAWRMASACVVVGEDMRATVAKRGVPDSLIHYLPNWAPRELERIAPDPEIGQQRRAWGLENKFIVAYSGNLGRVHEFATLLDAAQLLRDEPAIAFAFIGGGPRMTEVRSGAANRGLPNVYFFPSVERAALAAALAAADLHAVTLRPGFERLVNPSKLVGVLAAGRPALFVGPISSQIARFLTAQSAGHAVPNGDSAACAQEIRILAASRAQSTTARNAARHAFEQHFTFAQQLAAWTTLLKSVAANQTSLHRTHPV